jgi:hypothetical protein
MNSDVMWGIGGLAATIAGFFAIWKLEAITYIYDACPREGGIDFCLFRLWNIYFLPYAEIESVEVQPGWGSLFVYSFKNRLFSPSFLIKKKKGWFTKRILITPARSDEFRHALNNAHVPVNTSRARVTGGRKC